MVHIINSKLQDLGCTIGSFSTIAGVLDRNRISQFLKGEISLNPTIVDKLNRVLDEMFELKQNSFLSPDWSDAHGIREQLRQRREFNQAAEDDAAFIRRLLSGAEL